MLKPTRKRTTVAALTAATLTALVFAAPSAHAADPRTKFEQLKYGATYALGYIRWHARSVDVDYSIKAYGCRQLVAHAYDSKGVYRGGNASALVCNTTYTDTFNVRADVPGGAAYVKTFFTDEYGSVLDQGHEARP